MPQLTDSLIRSAPFCESGTRTIWDGQLKGFGLRISTTTKSFVVLIASGRRQTLGRYPLLPLADARKEAKRLLAEKMLGKIRPAHKAYEDAKDAFIADCGKRLRQSTTNLYRRHLTTHYPFARKSVGDITPHQILDQLRKLKPSEKEHAFRIGRTFFRWCVSEHLIDRSPMENLAKPPAGKSRERVLTEDELKAVYRTARKATSGFHRLISLLIHTGGRRSETTHLQWPSIASETLTFKAETRKVRKDQETDHTIPLTAATKELLDTFPRFDSHYLFPASRSHVKGKPTTVMTGYSAMKEDFDKECGVSGWTPHDLRRTMVTVMCEKLDVLPHIADWIIAHTSNQPSSAANVYNRARYLKQAREALTKWDEYLQTLLEKE